MSRKLAGSLVSIFMLLALTMPAANSISLAQAANVDVYGRSLPADAAP